MARAIKRRPLSKLLGPNTSGPADIRKLRFWPVPIDKAFTLSSLNDGKWLIIRLAYTILYNLWDPSQDCGNPKSSVGFHQNYCSKTGLVLTLGIALENAQKCTLSTKFEVWSCKFSNPANIRKQKIR
jgi:hypothetical protein